LKYDEKVKRKFNDRGDKGEFEEVAHPGVWGNRERTLVFISYL